MRKTGKIKIDLTIILDFLGAVVIVEKVTLAIFVCEGNRQRLCFLM